MMTRGDYGELHHRVFGKSAGREACRQGWQRWQELWDSGVDLLVLHPSGEPAPAPQSTDYHLIATQPRHARPQRQSPVSIARDFLHKSLVDGFWLCPEVGAAMGACIAWLITSHHGVGRIAVDYHMLGYDITYVPGPPGQARMFNFRTIVAREFDKRLLLDTSRSLPLPPRRRIEGLRLSKFFLAGQRFVECGARSGFGPELS